MLAATVAALCEAPLTQQAVLLTMCHCLRPTGRRGPGTIIRSPSQGDSQTVRLVKPQHMRMSSAELKVDDRF